LNRKLNEQRQISEAKLQQIASQLQSIVKLQQITHDNHQETNAKLQEANDKLRQIEKETKKQQQQTITNVPLLSFPSNATTCMPTFGSLQTLQPMQTLQPPISIPPTLQPTMPTNFPNGEPYSLPVNNNNNYNNPIFNNLNTTSNKNGPNNINSYSTPIQNNANAVNNNDVNSPTKNKNNNNNNNNNNSNNNRPSALTSVFNFLLGNTNNEDNNNGSDEDEDVINEEKHNTLEEDGWECSYCYSQNDENSNYCPSCGTQKTNHNNDMLVFDNDDNNNSTVKNDNLNNNKPKEIPKINNDLKLKCKGRVGEGPYEPNESRQCGWILTNNTKTKLKMKGYLQKIRGDDVVKVTIQKCYEFEISSNDEIYLLCDIVAPNTIGKYSLSYQFVSSQDGSYASDMLEIIVEVKSQFPKHKEEMIENCIKMGWNDRNQVVFALQRSNWNLQQAVDHLLSS